MSELDVDSVDLAELATWLHDQFDMDAPRGFIVGRTVLRDAVVERLSCSMLEGELLVDTMISRGYLRYSEGPGTTSTSARTGSGIWSVHPRAEADTRTGS